MSNGSVDYKLGELDGKFNALHERFDTMCGKLDKLEAKVDNLNMWRVKTIGFVSALYLVLTFGWTIIRQKFF